MNATDVHLSLLVCKHVLQVWRDVQLRAAVHAAV
eukprot:CAMPEP_0181304362 /NCGR_PEP_ID=MMETSP1101-20121128/9111_1 /TAXON_ID=46948 /ORGANISM="Rhodomonas abbreviata, Strain Caron Lab Isolate" /LENGTH=33 /DNA_ID= /DNA_START= /DNA_END= /DNA_ORIENTATION=